MIAHRQQHHLTQNACADSTLRQRVFAARPQGHRRRPQAASIAPVTPPPRGLRDRLLRLAAAAEQRVRSATANVHAVADQHRRDRLVRQPPDQIEHSAPAAPISRRSVHRQHDPIRQPARDRHRLALAAAWRTGSRRRVSDFSSANSAPACAYGAVVEQRSGPGAESTRGQEHVGGRGQIVAQSQVLRPDLIRCGGIRERGAPGRRQPARRCWRGSCLQ
jgi:hypothetical protein